jgi:hypothetical protein
MDQLIRIIRRAKARPRWSGGRAPLLVAGDTNSYSTDFLQTKKEIKLKKATYIDDVLQK